MVTLNYPPSQFLVCEYTHGKDRPAWGGRLSSVASAAEAGGVRGARTKRAVRRAGAASAATSEPTHMWAGLPSLDWTHQPPPDPQPAAIHLKKSWSSSTAEGRTIIIIPSLIAPTNIQLKLVLVPG